MDGGCVKAPRHFWICRLMFKLNAKFDADLLLYSFSHFECDGYTAYILTQWCLLSPLTSTVKSSLFTNAHSNPISLAARLHHVKQKRCYTNNGWTFPWQISYTCIYIHKNIIHLQYFRLRMLLFGMGINMEFIFFKNVMCMTVPNVQN